MVKFNNLFPIVDALGVFFLASTSKMEKKINQNHSTDKKIQAILLKGFTSNEEI